MITIYTAHAFPDDDVVNGYFHIFLQHFVTLQKAIKNIQHVGDKVEM